MPRVNRDLQRRMAARRERERRRPTERRYRFGTPGAPSDIDADEAAQLNGEEVAETSRADGPARTRPLGDAATGAQRAAPKIHKPFSTYRAEYGYVVGDLRRVALVIGSLLLILILLYLVLPH